jgi:hypothetical protein
MDARDFARKLIHETCIPMTQVVMNLPASAELFLGLVQLSSYDFYFLNTQQMLLKAFPVPANRLLYIAMCLLLLKMQKRMYTGNGQ